MPIDVPADTSDQEDAQERRYFQRFPARFPTRFKDASGRYGEDVTLRDFSASGVRLHTRERFFIDDVVSVEVSLPDGRDPLMLNGRVTWARRGNPSRWDLGVEFHKVQLFRLHRLMSYASELEDITA